MTNNSRTSFIPWRLFGPSRGRIFYGWWIVALGSLINAVGGGILFHGFTVFFLPLKNDFKASSTAISLLYGAARLEGGFEGPVVGYLISTLGPRAVIVAGVCMAGGGLLLLSLVNNYWAFFFIFVFVVYFGYNAGFFHPVTAAVNNWFIRNRGVGFSTVGAASCAGGMIMAPLLSWIVQDFGWRTGSITADLLLLTICLPATIPIRRSPELMGLRPDGASSLAGSGHEFQPGPDIEEFDFSVREALRTKAYWILMGAISLRLFVTSAVNAHFIPILVWRDMSETTGAYLVSLYALSSIFTTVAIGWIGDRWSKPLVCSLALMPLIIAMVGLVFSQAAFLLYVFAVGFAVAMGSAPLNWALIGDLFGRRSYATLRGTMAVSYGATGFFSPIYAGWICDSTGSYTLVLITFSGVLLVTGCLFAILSLASPAKSPRYFPAGRG
jgi:MFS family permease